MPRSNPPDFPPPKPADARKIVELRLGYSIAVCEKADPGFLPQLDTLLFHALEAARPSATSKKRQPVLSRFASAAEMEEELDPDSLDEGAREELDQLIALAKRAGKTPISLPFDKNRYIP